jgi:hypothetical protein
MTRSGVTFRVHCWFVPFPPHGHYIFVISAENFTATMTVSEEPRLGGGADPFLCKVRATLSQHDELHQRAEKEEKSA